MYIYTTGRERSSAHSDFFYNINIYLMSIDIEYAAHIEDLLVGECRLRDLEELPDDSQHGRHVSVIPGARER